MVYALPASLYCPHIPPTSSVCIRMIIDLDRMIIDRISPPPSHHRESLSGCRNAAVPWDQKGNWTTGGPGSAGPSRFPVLVFFACIPERGAHHAHRNNSDCMSHLSAYLGMVCIPPSRLAAEGGVTFA